MKSIKVRCFWGFGLLLLLATGSCGGVTQPLGDVGGAGSTSDHESSGSEDGSGNNGPSACETECVKKVFTGSAASCKLCHTSQSTNDGGLQSSNLDLQSPNVTARLKDVPAQHLDIPATTPTVMCPTGDLLIDSAAPQNSWLLKKLMGQQGTCGTKMPQPPTNLTAAEIACMQTYIFCVAGQTPP
jgi:hypothetical protein